uniref:Uncharacterized protein n=1 Tax=Schizaphis graminum TaxID=13262 RepID=A0A2S2PLX6_SCHGA
MHVRRVCECDSGTQRLCIVAKFYFILKRNFSTRPARPMPYCILYFIRGIMYIVMYYICVGECHTQRPILYYIYFNDMSIINIVSIATDKRCKTATAGCRIRSYCGRRNRRGSDDMRVESAKILHANLYRYVHYSIMHRVKFCVSSTCVCVPSTTIPVVFYLYSIGYRYIV